MMTKHIFRLEFEVDDHYENNEAFEDDLKQAVDNEESITIHIAGNHYAIQGTRFQGLKLRCKAIHPDTANRCIFDEGHHPESSHQAMGRARMQMFGPEFGTTDATSNPSPIFENFDHESHGRE